MTDSPVQHDGGWLAVICIVFRFSFYTTFQGCLLLWDTELDSFSVSAKMTSLFISTVNVIHYMCWHVYHCILSKWLLIMVCNLFMCYGRQYSSSVLRTFTLISFRDLGLQMLCECTCTHACMQIILAWEDEGSTLFNLHIGEDFSLRWQDLTVMPPGFCPLLQTQSHY